MIHLHQFPPAFGLPNASPFCMKVETYLRLAEIPYEVTPVMNPAKTPKGKAPFIIDGIATIADSHFILNHLKYKYGDPLGQGLSALERARHLALTRMMEDHLYFALLYERWIVPENEGRIRDAFFGALPGIVAGFVFKMAKKNAAKTLFRQGMGRHHRDEITRLGIEDVQALAAILGTDPYFGGGDPREIDCTAFAFIANLVEAPISSKITDSARAHDTLVDYAARMKKRVFPELG